MQTLRSPCSADISRNTILKAELLAQSSIVILRFNPSKCSFNGTGLNGEYATAVCCNCNMYQTCDVICKFVRASGAGCGRGFRSRPERSSRR